MGGWDGKEPLQGLLEWASPLVEVLCKFQFCCAHCLLELPDYAGTVDYLSDYVCWNEGGALMYLAKVIETSTVGEVPVCVALCGQAYNSARFLLTIEWEGIYVNHLHQ